MSTTVMGHPYAHYPSNGYSEEKQQALSPSSFSQLEDVLQQQSEVLRQWKDRLAKEAQSTTSSSTALLLSCVGSLVELTHTHNTVLQRLMATCLPTEPCKSSSTDALVGHSPSDTTQHDFSTDHVVASPLHQKVEWLTKQVQRVEAQQFELLRTDCVTLATQAANHACASEFSAHLNNHIEPKVRGMRAELDELKKSAAAHDDAILAIREEVDDVLHMVSQQHCSSVRVETRTQPVDSDTSLLQAMDVCSGQLARLKSRVDVLELESPRRRAVPYLGVELTDSPAGVAITKVHPGCVGHEAGLRVGDVFVSLSNEHIPDRSTYHAVLGELMREYYCQCNLIMENTLLARHSDSLVMADQPHGAHLHESRHVEGSSTLPFIHRQAALRRLLPVFELELQVLREGRLRHVVAVIPSSQCAARYC